jgi:CRP-like cAMP-binding protein
MSALDRVALFRVMSEESRERMARAATPVAPRDGSTLFAQGDAADAVYAIVEGDGQVRIGSIDHRSKGMMVAILRAGDVVGEIGVLDGGARTADAVVIGHLRLLRIGRAAFMSAMHEEPAIAIELARMLAERLRRTFALLEDASFETLEVRLARQVAYMARTGVRRPGQGVRLPGRLRQADLANLLGATPRSIITILNAWRAAGMVAYDTERAWLTVLDETRLAELCAPAA